MPIRIRCPECQALMQVADSAAGKRTKCPKCASLISVPATPNTSGPSAPRPRPAGTPPLKSPPAASGGKPPQGTPQPAGPTPQGNVRQVRCPKCRQVMRATAGATVRCPKCLTPVKVPAAGASQPSGSPPNTGFDFDDLPSPSSFGPSSFGPPPAGPSSFGPSSFGPVKPKASSPGGFSSGPSGGWSQAPNPYAPSGGAGGGFSAGGSRGGLPSGREAWHYVVPGVIFDIFGALLVVGIIARVALAALVLVNRQAGDDVMFVIAELVGSIVISGPIAAIYLMGGSALVRRRGLTAAKTVAVVACIPCFNCLVLTPIGIWACVLVFSDKADRDFRG